MNPLLLDYPAIFVTGTDTDVGKTYVSTLILNYLAKQEKRVIGMKPIASGLFENDDHWVNVDVLRLQQASNVVAPQERINHYAFKPEIAPHIAAQQAKRKIEFSHIVDDLAYCQNVADHVVVEGVGGWCVPLNGYQQSHQSIAGLAEALALPVVLVVGVRLGCINHAVLTAQAIAASGVPLLGWVANNLCIESDVSKANIDTLRALLPAQLLFEVPFQP